MQKKHAPVHAPVQNYDNDDDDDDAGCDDALKREKKLGKHYCFQLNKYLEAESSAEILS